MKMKNGNRGFLKKVLGGIWQLKDVEWNLKIKEKFDTGLFLTFTFASESIQSRILSKMPWYISNEVLILGKMENSNESWKHDLTSFPIWGRAWDVPIDLLTVNNTVRVATKAGEVITVQNSDVSKMVADGFFRFRVWMSINKPVCPGFPLPYKGSKKWITFQYEELPFMCFKCGKIGHSYKDCHQNPTLILEEGKEGTVAYGKWLKVGNGAREGMQGDRQGMGKNNSIDKNMQQSPINTERTTTASSSPSLPTMGDASSGSMKGTENRDTTHGQEQQLLEGGSKSTPKNHDSKAGDMGKEEIHRRNDDGNRGKHRIVEDYGDLGYVKLKKLTTDLSKEFQDHELYNIPVSYAHEARRHNTTRWRTRFHFKSAWAEDEECSNIVQSVWQQDKKISNTRELQNRLGKCGHALQQWNKTKKLEMTRHLKEYEDKISLLTRSTKTTTRCEIEDTIKVMWAIWENRNRKWKQLPSMIGQQLISWIFSTYPNILKVENDVVHQEVAITIKQKQWIPPANGCICVNCDAAVIDKATGVGLGFIWRKVDGQILSAGQIYMQSICLAKMAEAWAILEALKNPPADATNQIEVQTGCRVMVEEINN
ncbi:hypothetical protein G4B88_007908 [Cannabis sativa]|uniref:CCHC-type domain-containing protein n=1 Tax=Cannabis sativa TaxID=3483 RepID=A0A7J6I6N1_CANSA|nr:hypothetical protein G4B88_007908 [Cannabis sativa]